MKTINKTVILLQYPKLGEIGPFGHVVKEDTAEKFVALDSASGGYPCAVDIDQAHDFKSIDAAHVYRGHYTQLAIRVVDITYTIN